MKLIYHGQHGPEVTVGNPGLTEQVVMVAGVEADVPDELGHALIGEQPGVFSTTALPQRSASKEAWAAFREAQGHDVDGLTKEQLIELPDIPKGS